MILLSVMEKGSNDLSVAAFPRYRRAGGGASLTDLQRHVEYFDKIKDGVITVTESTQGTYTLITLYCYYFCTATRRGWL
jgi:hypothetical protein